MNQTLFDPLTNKVVVARDVIINEVFDDILDMKLDKISIKLTAPSKNIPQSIDNIR